MTLVDRSINIGRTTCSWEINTHASCPRHYLTQIRKAPLASTGEQWVPRHVCRGLAAHIVRPRPLAMVLAAAFALITLLATRPAPASDKPKLAVMPMVGVRVEKGIAEVLGDILTVEVGNLGRYQVISADEMNAMLGLEKMKEVVGCDDVSCAAEIGGALGVDYMVSGKVGRLGSKLLINLSFFDNKKMKVIRRVRQSVVRNENLYEQAIIDAIGKLFRVKVRRVAAAVIPPVGDEVISEHAAKWEVGGGDLVIVPFSSDPPGAVVMVDGKLACQDTSQGCSKDLSIGAHTVSMQKKRYLERTETVVVKKGTKVSWKLIPHFGWLTVSSMPSGLAVKINGQEAGRTPLPRRELAPGRYEVLVTDRCHYDQGKRVTISKGDEKTISVRLKPRQGAVQVSAVDKKGNSVPAEVLVDGKRVGQTPGTFKVSICAKALEVRSKEHGTFKQGLSVRERKVAPIQAKLDDAVGEGMVLIPAGPFKMGCNSARDRFCVTNEKPYHEVYLDAFSIDKHEVTVAQYQRCVEAGRCVKPRDKSDIKYCNWGHGGREDHPINCVSWHDARKYCKWAGKQLPTEAQWEKAARGTDGRIYPWGNQGAGCKYAIVDAIMDDGSDGCGRDRTWPVCSKLAGNSPYGLCDMSGNVWEWVSDWYGEGYYGGSSGRNPKGPGSGSQRVLRGGGWGSLISTLRADHRRVGHLRASSRDRHDPTLRSPDFGFRCVSRAQ